MSDPEQPDVDGDTVNFAREAKLAQDKVFLDAMLHDQDDPYHPGQRKGPGWMLVEDDPDTFGRLLPVSEAFLAAGGVLALDELESLYRYLSVVVNARATIAQTGRKVTQATPRLDEHRSQVRRLRDEARAARIHQQGTGQQ